MKIKFSAFILLLFFAAAKFNPSFAQNAEMKWAVGLGINAVNDDGRSLPAFKNMMGVPYPSSIHGGLFLGNGVTLDATISYNKYVNGKIINGEESTNVTSSNNLYFSFDAIIKYDLHEFYNQVYGKKKISKQLVADNVKKFRLFDYFDPYALFGYGYTYRAYSLIPGHTDAVTNNLGLGFNVWIKPYIGLNFQGMAKFRMINQVSNHSQFSFGVIYRFSKIGTGAANKLLNDKM